MEYRAYEPGDEPRFVDWNVYARSGKLFTRKFQAQRSTRVYLVLDESASMSAKQSDAAQIAADHCPYGQSHEGRSRKMPFGGRIGLCFKAG